MKTAITVFCLFLSVSITHNAHAEDLRIGLASEPTSMDPHFHNLGPNNSLLSHIYDALISQDENQQLVPALAES